MIAGGAESAKVATDCPNDSYTIGISSLDWVAMIRKTASASKVRAVQAVEAVEVDEAADTSPAQKGRLTDLAYEQIEEAIITLRLAPGTSVSELQLSEMTGIGRTPIREAIQRLAREHLVVVLPQRGLLVPQIDVAKQLKLLET